MRLIHCADLHLDSKMTANLSKEQARERKAELLNTFVRMVKYGEEQKVKAILIAGDLYDTRNISAAAKNVLQDTILSHPDIEFYYLRGNHDGESFLSAWNPLPENLKLFSKDWTTYVLGEQENITISGVELSRDNTNTIYNTLVLKPECCNIVMLHGQEVETNASGKEETISLRRLQHKNIDYLALGHVHEYREGALDSRGVYCYSGCLEGRGFDECGEHGFVLLNVDEQTGKIEREFVPFASRRLYEVFVDVTGSMTTSMIAQKVGLALEAYSPDSLVKLVLVGEVDVACEKNLDFLQKQFEDSFYFFKVLDETKFQVDYQAFALDASLKGEFVRQVMGAEDISSQDQMEIVRYGIQALAGEELMECD